jgi:hypothetical protein
MDLDTLLRTSAAVPDPAPAALHRGRAALESAALEAATYRSSALRARRRRTRRLGITALVATAAAAALVVVPTLGTGGGSSAQAAEVLRRTAVAAGEQPGGWPDAAYWHSVSTYRQGVGPDATREIWIAHDGTGVLRSGSAPGEVIPLGKGAFPAGGTSLSWDDLYALPTEPTALEAVLRAGIHGAGKDDDSELFTIVGDLLRESPASPALRKALWEVAARVPGVTLIGPVTDSVGRPGTAVQRGDQRYVVDPSDGRLLEESSGSPGPVAEAPGGADWRATYLEQGPAESAPAPTVADSSAMTH